MLDKSKRWNVLHVMIPIKDCKCAGVFRETHSYSLGKDSIMKGKVYHELFDSVINVNSYGNPTNYSELIGYIAESDKKIYMINRNIYQPNENLLYDFNLSVGDTFKSQYFNHILIKIDSSEYYNKKYRTFHFADSLVWIEGIGSTSGFINNYNYPDTLLCVSENDTLIYKNNLGYDCVIAVNIDNIEEMNNPNDFKIYPNPTSEKIFIESNKIINRINLTDIYGKLIYQCFPEALNYTLSLSSIEKGIYFVRINDHVRKIIKE